MAVPRGIKCDLEFKQKVSNDYEIEQEMKRRGRVDNYLGQRNMISVASLGDKPYKSAPYSTDFFKTPGLYPGSTNAMQKRNMAKKNEVDFTISKKAVWPMRPATLWEHRLKRETKDSELKDVVRIDNWEETVLKEHRDKLAPAQPKNAKPAPVATKTKK